MRRFSLLQSAAKMASKSSVLKKVGTKLAVQALPDEVETNIDASRFIFRPKTDGLWYLNYSDAEPGLEKILRENVKEGDTFVDIGAYIGHYSLLARTIVGESGQVIAFEPNPESYKMLKRNIELNEYTNCIPEDIALSDEEGLLKLFIGQYTDDSSSLFLAEEVDETRSVTVKAITFDRYCELHKITPGFIKIDAEGAEYKILKGMQSTLEHHPKLLVEIHPRHLERQGISLHSLFDFLKARGYGIQLVMENGGCLVEDHELIKSCRIGRENDYGTLINQVIFCHRL